MEKNKKRPVGRPPNHDPANQYTGVRAKNIDYVRQFLRKFLESEKAADFTLAEPSGRGGRRGREAMAMYCKQIMHACRMLLACEKVHINVMPNVKAKSTMLRLQQLGEGVKEGTVGLPALLDELDSMRGGESDDDI